MVRSRLENVQWLRSTLRSVLRYAIATGRGQSDVTVDLQGALIAPKVKHYASIIEPAKVGELLRAIEGYEGQPTVGIALRMAPHVFVRPGELRSAERSEEHTSELQSLMRNSYAVFCLKKKIEE